MTGTARIYGGSLYELAREERREDRIMDELREICGIFASEPEYVRLLMNPALTKDERKKALSEAFEGRIDEYLLNFLKLSVDNGILSQLSAVREAYVARYNSDNGILPVECVSAVALSDKERGELTEALMKKTGKKIVLTQKVDPSLLGGVKLSYGGKLFDGTVSARLSEIDSIFKAAVL